MKKVCKFLLWFIAFANIAFSSNLVYGAEISLGDKFNFEHLSGLDLGALNSKNFYEKVIPVAKKQKEVSFYNFAAGAFPDLYKNIIPKFEKKYGVKVNVYNVTNDLAVQQLIATKNANKPSPADVFFMPDVDLNPLMNNDLMGNVNLYELLPNTQSDIEKKTDTFGVKHGGSYVTFHANQVAIGFNSSVIKREEVPTSYEELLAYSVAHPKSVAITSPVRGGSGIGFLVGVAYHNLSTEACKAKWNSVFPDTEATKQWVENSGCFTKTWEYIRKLYSNVELTNGNADTLSLISNSVAKIGTVWEDMVYGEINTGGANPAIRMSLLKDGMPGSSNGLVILSSAQHVAGGLLLLDYLMSDEAQVDKLKFMASRSPKKSLSLESLPEEAKKLLIPANEYRDYHIGWSSMTVERALKEVVLKEVLENLKK